MAEFIVNLNGKPYVVVPRRSGEYVDSYLVKQYGESFRPRGGQLQGDLKTPNVVFYPPTYGFGRDRMPSDKVGDPIETRRFWDSTCLTWFDGDVRLPLLSVDSTETGLEVIRASAAFKGNLWGLWDDTTSTEVAARKYVGSTVTWTAGGTICGTPYFDSSTKATKDAAASPWTFSHTCRGQDRYLVVGIAMDDANGQVEVSGVTYGGTAMTRLDRLIPAANLEVTLWYLANPAAGSNTVSISHSLDADLGAVAVVMSFCNVQARRTLSTQTATGTSTTPSVAAATTVNLDMVVDFVGQQASASFTAGAGQTERQDGTVDTVAGASSTEVTTGSPTTMSWTSTANAAWGILSVAIAPFSAIVPRDLMAHKTHMLSLLAVGRNLSVFRSTDGATWTPATTDIPSINLLSNVVTANEDIDAGLLAEIGGEAVAVCWDETNGTITFFSSTDAGVTWTDEAVDIPSGNGPQGVAVMGGIDNEDKLYVATREGLWEVDVSAATWTMALVLSLPPHNDNGRRMTVHQGALWFAQGVNNSAPAPIWRMTTTDGGRVFDSSGGLDQGDGVPTDLLGSIHWMKSAGRFLLASVGGGAASRNGRVLVHNGFGWHSAAKHGTANRKVEWVDYSADDDGTPRLHYAVRTGAGTSDTLYMAYALTNPASLPSATLNHEASGVLDLPETNGGMPTTNGALLQVRLEAADLSADANGEYVNVDRGVNGAARTTDVGDFYSGTKTRTLASGAGIEAISAALRLNLARDAGNTTDSPKVRSVEVVYDKLRDYLEGWVFTVDLRATARLQGAADLGQVATALRTALALATLPAFDYANSGTKYVRLAGLSWRLRPYQESGSDVGGSVSDVIGYVEVTVEEIV